MVILGSAQLCQGALMMASGDGARNPTKISRTSSHFSPWSLSSCSLVRGHFALRSSRSALPSALRCTLLPYLGPPLRLPLAERHRGSTKSESWDNCHRNATAVTSSHLRTGTQRRMFVVPQLQVALGIWAKTPEVPIINSRGIAVEVNWCQVRWIPVLPLLSFWPPHDVQRFRLGHLAEDPKNRCNGAVGENQLIGRPTCSQE